ncbi:MAG: hypothetical protein H6841_01880 [Planctomycetes bacterium]|nr:hypothetical protein [Planctomycetota bacterium]
MACTGCHAQCGAGFLHTLHTGAGEPGGVFLGITKDLRDLVSTLTGRDTQGWDGRTDFP